MNTGCSSPGAPCDHGRLLARRSFIEMRARERARALLDPGSFRELLGPFDRLKSPWLPPQGIVAQADDGVVLVRGTLDQRPALVAAIESAYQGGSIGEVSGAKIAGALERACRDWENGHPVLPVLLLETGGVRLQEANLGLAAIAEIHAAIVALQRHVPVVCVVAGMVGCFGGMSLAAAMCSHLIITRQARLGMNGPEVIEQEAGVAELDAADRVLVWSLIGGAQRFAAGMADELLEDDADAMAVAVRTAFAQDAPAVARTLQVDRYRRSLAAVDPLRALGNAAGPLTARSDGVTGAAANPSRGRIWFDALTGGAGTVESGLGSVAVADVALAGEAARIIAIVPDLHNRFPRARAGELGIEEAWALAWHVRRTMAADHGGVRRPIIAIVDVSSQAYGRLEELLGIHLACAAAVDAYASARIAGHPVISLLVGKAMSGGFLAHGYQANRIIALDSPEVMVHAMGRKAAARVTQRSVADLQWLGERFAPMAYDIHSFAKLGLLHALVAGMDTDNPGGADVERVRAELVSAIADTRSGSADLSGRLTSPGARTLRAASIEVRRRLVEQWDAT